MTVPPASLLCTIEVVNGFPSDCLRMDGWMNSAQQLVLAQSFCYSSCGVFTGIDNGQSLKLQGEGGAPAIREGTPGNLFVEFSIAADPVLRRQGPHIHVSIDLDFVDAILGGDSK